MDATRRARGANAPRRERSGGVGRGQAARSEREEEHPMMTRLVARMRALIRRAPHHPGIGAPPDDGRARAESLAARRPDRVGRLGLSWLDFKVGARMLARYPGLTLVGTVAIAVA